MCVFVVCSAEEIDRIQVQRRRKSDPVPRRNVIHQIRFAKCRMVEPKRVAELVSGYRKHLTLC